MHDEILERYQAAYQAANGKPVETVDCGEHIMLDGWPTNKEILPRCIDNLMLTADRSGRIHDR